MRTFLKWSVFVLLVAISVLVVVYLPEYMALQKDHEYVNQYQLYQQNISDEAYMDMNLLEKMEIFLLIDNAQGNNICVTETQKAEEVLKSNASLFEELKKQIEKLQELQLIPTISTQLAFAENMTDAELYALTSDQHPGKVLYVWKLSFMNENMACSVTMDADTYQIYDFYASGPVVKNYVENTYIRRMEAAGGEFYSLYRNWFDDYLCYLYDKDALGGGKSDDTEYESVVEDLKWSGIEALGWIRTDSFVWNLHLFMDMENQIFHFRMSNTDEYDEGVSSVSVPY